MVTYSRHKTILILAVDVERIRVSFPKTDSSNLFAPIYVAFEVELDYDEIFRKDQDGGLRMLLSFQNDYSRSIEVTVP